MAEQQGLDLVEVAPSAKPPVCRIMDYGKYRYEQTKRIREAHKHQTTIKLKEIRLRPNIETHDFETKLHHAQEFLEKRYKIRVSIFFRGRENLHKERGKEIINKFVEDLKDYGTPESPPKALGKMIIVNIGPTGKPKKKN